MEKNIIINYLDNKLCHNLIDIIIKYLTICKNCDFIIKEHNIFICQSILCYKDFYCKQCILKYGYEGFCNDCTDICNDCRKRIHPNKGEYCKKCFNYFCREKLSEKYLRKEKRIISVCELCLLYDKK